MSATHGPPPLTHRTADFRGITSPLLRDGDALSGLMISASGAAGLATTETPIVRTLPRDGIAIILLLDVGHITVHTLPARETLLLDLLLPWGRDPQKAVDVFSRKLGVSEARASRLDRG